MFEAVESKEELERQTKGVFAKEGLGSSGGKELRGVVTFGGLQLPRLR
jgi:hypothetical protein